ncbi:MAG: hypothetical protein AXA67_13440 [Methylothermaceae bacteria B42]|nr:MAG: hypothetical protein AXA67_13440 [Methylothermaceae bacteria B42]
MIDWITVIAQIVNFLILLALLKRFLYRPIVANMEARERYIESRLNEAARLRAKAERMIATYRQKLEAIETQRQEILKQACQEAESERQALLEKAREEVAQKRLQWMQELAQEQAALLNELKNVLTEQLLELSRKALRDLADFDLETLMVKKFLQQLASLSLEQKRLLMESGENVWKVTTSFTLKDTQRQQIESALKQLRSDITIEFDLQPNLLCGIALEADGRIWHWNLAAYLDELESSLKQALPA